MLPKPIEELVFSMKLGRDRAARCAPTAASTSSSWSTAGQGAKPLADVKEELRMQLRQKEMERQTKNYLSELRKKTLVDIR